MEPYVALVIVSMIFSFLSYSGSFKHGKLILGDSSTIKYHNMGLPIFFFFLFILLAFRHETIGRDLLGYKFYFTIWKEYPLNTFFEFENQALFKLFTSFIGKLGLTFQFYLAITAALIIYPIAKVYCEDRSCTCMKIALFVNMSTYVMLFSGIRQSLAMAVGMIAYEYIKEKKILQFIGCTLIAIGIHHSGFMLIFMYPLYHYKITKKTLLFIFPLISIMFIFNKQIFTILTAFLGSYSDKYALDITTTGAYGSLILFIIFMIFTHIVPDEDKLTEEDLGLRNFLLFAVLLQCFAPIHPLAMRLNYYFILFIPIVMGKIIAKSSKRYSQISRYTEIIITLFFILLYIYSVYKSTVTGISALDTVPYIPFWAK